MLARLVPVPWLTAPKTSTPRMLPTLLLMLKKLKNSDDLPGGTIEP
jgi:hypothetical protein